MDSLIHPHERVYLALCVFVTALIYIMLLISLVGIAYLIIGAVFLFMVNAIATGHIRGNAVAVTERQMPQLYAKVVMLREALGLPSMPEVYIMQAGGVLNAFATRFMGRNMIVIYSEILELAYERGEDEVAFVVAHELAHLKRNHPFWRWIVAPAMFVPLLGNGYSRACEYTCDAIGAHVAGAAAISGLVVLAAGRRVYRDIDVGEFVGQIARDDFWIQFAERFSTHPRLPKRIARLERMGIAAPALAAAAT